MRCHGPGATHHNACDCREAAHAEEVAKLTRERDKARADYQFMVDRAINEKLDGYRELGARAAAAENDRDAWKRAAEMQNRQWSQKCTELTELRAETEKLTREREEALLCARVEAHNFDEAREALRQIARGIDSSDLPAAMRNDAAIGYLRGIAEAALAKLGGMGKQR